MSEGGDEGGWAMEDVHSIGVTSLIRGAIFSCLVSSSHRLLVSSSHHILVTHDLLHTQTHTNSY